MTNQPENKRMVSIIPGGVMQFLDFTFDLTPHARRKLYFSEKLRADASASTTGQAEKELICLDWNDQRQEAIERLTGKPGDYDYELELKRVLEIFQDTWVPVPMLRVKNDRWPQDGLPRFEKGPCNWCRVFITAEENEGDAKLYRLTVAFDTQVEELIEDEESYVALSTRDVQDNAQFMLAHMERDIAWLLNAHWMRAWVGELYEKHKIARRKGKRGFDEEEPYLLQDTASYLTFLELLHKLDLFPTIRVVDPQEYPPIDVDLVLDIGNSRTCGFLIESHPQSPTNLNDSYVLQIRDLDNPGLIYEDPFDTRTEFSKVNFGNEALSARSGRETEAFVWPSPVRVGPEATRLSSHSWGGEGNTGMSSPKRYLWDERTRVQQWRYNGYSAEGVREPPATSGLYTSLLNKEGTPLSRMQSQEVKRHPVLKKQENMAAFEARFTRSSLMMFLLSEIITQALVTMNSPAQRGKREHADIPRRLRRIILSVPTAMPLAEHRIFRRWANWAVEAIWNVFGWNACYVDRRNKVAQRSQQPTGSRHTDYRTSPEIHCNWDEATSTQLVYLYNELSEKFQGDAHQLFAILGTPRPARGDAGNPSLRIATIDIGGGTTDLSIVTYGLQGDESHGSRLVPYMEFREGFRIAGDDILCVVIEDHVMRDLRDAVARAGVANPKGLLSSIFSRDMVGQSQAERNRRGQFARQIASNIGIYLLSRYELCDSKRTYPTEKIRIRDIFSGRTQPPIEVIAFFDDKVRQAGGVDFSLLDTEICINFNAIDRSVRKEMGRMLSDLAEIVYSYDCDLLLLSGRPSRLPGVQASIFAKLPVPADRIIPMSSFHIGRWYPFANYLGEITDPKTTVVVGGILATLAQGQLVGFSLDTGNLQLKSTARFIGEMDLDGRLNKNRVWFQVDVDATAETELSKEVIFTSPLSIGFRQLDAERWTTTRYYLLDFSSADARDHAKNRLPYKITLSYHKEEIDEEIVNPDADEGEIKIDEILDAKEDPVRPADLEIRLQTLPHDEGYWLDTGIFNIV